MREVGGEWESRIQDRRAKQKGDPYQNVGRKLKWKDPSAGDLGWEKAILGWKSKCNERRTIIHFNQVFVSKVLKSQLHQQSCTRQMLSHIVYAAIKRFCISIDLLSE